MVVANTPGKVNKYCHPLRILKGVSTRLSFGGHNYVRLLGGYYYIRLRDPLLLCYGGHYQISLWGFNTRLSLGSRSEDTTRLALRGTLLD